MLPVIKHIAFGLAIAQIIFFCASSYATVTADPAVLVFHNNTQTETVVLMADGKPVPAENVKGWRFLVDQRNYSHMLLVTPTAEGVRIRPSATAEVGSYALVMDTPEGSVSLQVYMPLSDEQSSVEALAQRMNLPVDEIQKQMGMTQRLGRDVITLNLLPVYYLGQRIQIDMPGKATRTALWKVNGKTVQEGPDAYHLDYVAAEPGPTLLVYEERENGAVTATATALTEIAAEPPILYETGTNTTLTLQAPPGFAEYAWLMDGTSVTAGTAFSHTFVEPGEHTITIKCTSPTSPGGYAFREVRYAVKVVSK